jgi:hypothetical protein
MGVEDREDAIKVLDCLAGADFRLIGTGADTAVIDTDGNNENKRPRLGETSADFRLGARG